MLILARLPNRYRFIAMVIFLLVVVSCSYSLSESAQAAPVVGFKAGRIIDDTVFTNKATMSVAQIQSFLNNKVTTCDTAGAQISEYGGPDLNSDGKVQRWEWGKANYNQTTFVCLRDYVDNGKTSAQLIYDTAQEFSINPQVLIVLLQKEQGLVQDTWPLNVQYRSATGYGCPDTAACDSQYYGLTNQVRWAATMFRAIMNDSPTWYTPYVMGSNYIQYNPSASCGGSDVNILNRATQALYNYTPYQPSQAVLDAGWGTVDCGAYGNRNFYNYFTAWFGVTYYNDFQSLDMPRWMQIENSGSQKVDVMTGEKVGEVFTAGRQIRFLDKVLIGDKWHLRTEFNYGDGGLYAIPQEALAEIPYQSITPKWATFMTDGNRSNPASRTIIGDNLIRGTSVKIVDQITIDGNIYYRTEYNKNNNQNVGIHSRFVTDFQPISLETPRTFCSNSPVNRMNPQTGVTTNTVEPDTHDISKKTLINSVWYFQAVADENTLNFFSSNDLHDDCYVPFEGPRNMRITEDVIRFNPYTNKKLDTLTKNTVVGFSTKIFLNDQWYFRTTHNTLNNIDAVVPASSVSD